MAQANARPSKLPQLAAFDRLWQLEAIKSSPAVLMMSINIQIAIRLVLRRRVPCQIARMWCGSPQPSGPCPQLGPCARLGPCQIAWIWGLPVSTVRPFQRSAGRSIAWVAVCFLMIWIWALVRRFCRGTLGLSRGRSDAAQDGGPTMRRPLRAAAALASRSAGDFRRFGWVWRWRARIGDFYR